MGRSGPANLLTSAEGPSAENLALTLRPFTRSLAQALHQQRRNKKAIAGRPTNNNFLREFPIMSVVARLSAVLVTLVALIAGPMANAANDLKSYMRPQQMRVPKDNELTPERIALGRMLFFDPRLSGSNWISCATCHNPALGWSDGLPTMIGDGMKHGNRRTPTIVNVAYNNIFMWDGRFRTLEEQALGPITSEGEMNQNLSDLIGKIYRIPEYREQFKKAYPNEALTPKVIGKAIAAYERSIVSADAPFDRWVKGERRAISDAAARGFALFEGKAKCNACHQGFNFSDNGFHNLGLKATPGVVDNGRYSQRPIAVNRGAFKTPTLRNVSIRAPYMHNGMYQTLEEVVQHYNRGGDVKANLDPNMNPAGLGLTKSDVADLVAFMKTLTEERTEAAIIPTLPQ